MIAAMAGEYNKLFQGMSVNEPGSPFEIGKTPYSVIQLSFSGCARPGMSVDCVSKSISAKLVDDAFGQHDLNLDETMHPPRLLRLWLQKLRSKDGHPIVLLIDEYDAPVTTFLPQDPERAHEVAMMLKPFYETIKDYGDYFHKVFVTGVSKFSSTSMFSGPNQFLPLMERTAEFCALYGFTEHEIRKTYGSYIEEKFDVPLDDVIDNMKRMYHGYRIHPRQKDEDVLYNPWSVLNYLRTGELVGYWAKSAGSASVMSMLGLRGMNIMNGFEITQERLFADISAKEYTEHWQQMSFQSGYSTIKRSYAFDESFDPRKTRMEMGPPNEEVTNFLESGMAQYIVGLVNPKLLRDYRKFLCDLDFENACSVLGKIIAQQAVAPSNEVEFGAYAIYSLMTHEKASRCLDIAFEHGIKLDEEEQSRGKCPTVDGAMLVHHQDAVVLLVIELKFEARAKDGANQIEKKRYIRRACSFFEQRNPGLVIEKEVAVCFNLIVTPEIKVILKQ